MRDMDSFFEFISNILRIIDFYGIFSNRLEYGSNIGLLKTQLPYSGISFRAEGGNLAGDI